MKKKILFIFSVLFLIVSVSLAANAYIELRQPGVIVLLYHRITDNMSKHSNYTVGVKQFERHLELIRKNHFKTILPMEIFQANQFHNEDKLIILSFDDGTEDHYQVAYPFLRRHNMKGLFFVVTKYINGEVNLTENQIREMAKNDMEFGSHSHSHPYLDILPPSLRVYELVRSKKDLEAVLGMEVLSFAPPGGWFNREALSEAKGAGYKAFFSCEIGRTDLESPPFIFKRIEVLGDMSE
jgi:peptidoglycan/xylan/chitin deacetylase (PgdA/CDA1 family)